MIPLLVDLETQWRGGQNQFLLLLKGLTERGHAAELLAAKGSELGHRASKAGICVHYASRDWLRVPAALMIRRLLRDRRIDLVHVNESHALSAAWMVAAHRRMPLFISRRVGFPLGSSYFSRARFAAASRIIASSKWVAEQAALSGALKEKLTVIYEGVAVPTLFDESLRCIDRARWGISQNDQLIGCAGVLLEDKGQEWVIRVLARVREEFPNCKLLLAGDGLDRRRLESIVSELNLKDAVIFAGFIRDIEAFYRSLDVFVFPALFEGLGTSLLAAMAQGVPSITYFGCALGEIVENGKSGLQVEPRDSHALASAIGSILRDRQFAASLGAAARQRIESTFTAERMVDETARLYQQVLA